MEGVEIDVMSNSDNVAIRKVKMEGGKEGYWGVRELILQAVTAATLPDSRREESTSL